jgi:hypothetical protein
MATVRTGGVTGEEDADVDEESEDMGEARSSGVRRVERVT